MKFLLMLSLISFTLLLNFSSPVSVVAQNQDDQSLIAEWNFSFNTNKGVWFQSPVGIARKADGMIVAAVLSSTWIKLTKGEIKGENLLLEGSSDYGAVKIEAQLIGAQLSGQWQIGDKSGSLKAGRNNSTDSSAFNPLEVFDFVQAALDKQFYDPQFNGIDWKQVSANYRRQAATAKSDAELVIIIRNLLKELGTSHLDFYRNVPASLNSSSEQKKEQNSGPQPAPTPDPPIVWKKLSPEIGYLKIKRFDEGKEAVALVDSAFTEVGNLKSLVIDLRDNQGGTLSIGMRLGDYLFPEMRSIGYLTTRKGFDRLKVKSSKEIQLSSLPAYTDYNVDGFLKELEDSGIVMLKTGGRVSAPYSGRLVVLINENSASATEGFVAAIKESAKATFIGTRTAGALLSSTIIDVPGGWKLRLPVADFVTAGGIRVEGKGIEPDIIVQSVKSEDAALKKAMEVLTKK